MSRGIRRWVRRHLPCRCPVRIRTPGQMLRYELDHWNDPLWPRWLIPVVVVIGLAVLWSVAK